MLSIHAGTIVIRGRGKRDCEKVLKALVYRAEDPAGPQPDLAERWLRPIPDADGVVQITLVEGEIDDCARVFEEDSRSTG
jgi:hypothetical protein